MKLYAVFLRGLLKSRGVPSQLPHSPHPISTIDYTYCFYFDLCLVAHGKNRCGPPVENPWRKSKLGFGFTALFRSCSFLLGIIIRIPCLVSKL